MKPGPTIIRKCSACSNLIAQSTIMSENNFGAKYWTDGRCIAPMLSDKPWLVKCQHCGTLVWINEQEEVEESAEPDDDVASQDQINDCALPYETPSIQDYFAALAHGAFDNKKERYIRIQTWWAGNDDRRQELDAAPLSEAEAANLRALAALLDDKDDNARIMKAEAMRELGLFAEAVDILSQPFPKGFSKVVALIKGLAEQKIASVREIVFH